MTSDFLFGAKLTTRFVVDGNGLTDAQAVAQQTMIVNGTFDYNQATALDALHKSCDAELTRVKTLFGARLLGGGCHAPQNLTTSGFLMTAPFHAFVMKTSSAATDVPGAIRAATQSFNQSEALAAWRDACAAAGAKVASDALLGFDCGSLQNLPTSGFLYGSASTLSVAGGHVETGGVSAFGAFDYNQATAFAGWQKACEASIGLAKDLLGDRYIAGVCQEPTNSGPRRSRRGARVQSVVTRLQCGGVRWHTAAMTPLPSRRTRRYLPKY